MTRPACPACLGTLFVGFEGAPCTSCDDGTMRGIDDPSREERRIAELEARVAELREANGPDARLVAVRAAVAAIEPFRGEVDRMDLIWRVARALEIPKDLRPCCANDEAPCVHGKPCDCWACRKLVARGIERAVRR